MKKVIIKSEDYQCLACSNKTSSFIGTYEFKNLIKIYKELTLIEFSQEVDNLLITFCDICTKQLRDFNSFKKLCEETYQLLESQWQNEVKTLDKEPHLEEVDFCDLKSENEIDIQPLEQSSSLICDLCGFTSTLKYVLKSHFKLKHSFDIHESGKKEPQKRKFNLHCPRKGCGKRFAKEDRLRAHLRIHDGKKPEVCPICGMELKTLRILKRHLETHNTERNKKCSYCEKAFKTKVQLEVHERYIHRRERAFICNQCGAVFYNPTGLNTHVYNKHNPERKFQCDECPRAFKHAYDLQDHKIRHKGTKDVLCSKCDKTFVTIKDLKKHDRENHRSIDRSAQCEVCSNILKDKKTLKQHMFTHTGERPFKCSFCSKAFTIKKALERHLTTHTGIKPFNCNFCTKGFAERFYLNRHIERHHGVAASEVNIGIQDRRFLSKLGPSTDNQLSENSLNQ